MSTQWLNSLLPPICSLCKRQCQQSKKQICNDCLASIEWLGDGLCERCALPKPCSPCPAGNAPFEASYAVTSYTGVAKELVVALKYRRNAQVANLMAEQITTRIKHERFEGFELVAVPQQFLRRCERGYSQSALLAERLAYRWGLNVSQLLRRRGFSRQTGSSRSKRLQIQGIKLSCSGNLPAAVLLIDDVHTTGATFKACAELLKAAGVQRVECLAYARTL